MHKLVSASRFLMLTTLTTTLARSTASAWLLPSLTTTLRRPKGWSASPTTLSLKNTYYHHPQRSHRNTPRCFSSAVPTSSSSHLSKTDLAFLQQAVDCARRGLGHTFPNPAVGCVLVRYTPNESSNNMDDHDPDDETSGTHVVLGQGYHPRAGYPHAEVFALLEAAGHVRSGIEAADAVVQAAMDATVPVPDEIERLRTIYTSDDNGPETLFAGCCGAKDDTSDANSIVTAYVTLEPCCHVGRTPPCASSLTLAQVQRVVVGYRDPNPKVDGGGMAWLDSHNVATALAFGQAKASCASVVTQFVQRMAPMRETDETGVVRPIDTGKQRRQLRAVAARRHADGGLTTVQWGGGPVVADANDDKLESAVAALPMAPAWLDHVDQQLWQHELVLLRLGSAIRKKKYVQQLGQRVVDSLNDSCAGGSDRVTELVQTKGHTVLLYRPGRPAVLDLDAIETEQKANRAMKETVEAREE